MQHKNYQLNLKSITKIYLNVSTINNYNTSNLKILLKFKSNQFAETFIIRFNRTF